MIEMIARNKKLPSFIEPANHVKKDHLSHQSHFRHQGKIWYQGST